MKKYEDLANFIISHVGGTANVVSLTHCVTRLRFKLKDEGKADKQALEQHDGIVSVVQKGGQYQVVIGNHVEDVYDTVMEVGGFKINEETKNNEKGLFNKFVGLVSGIFMPVLGLLCACGIIKGLSVFLASLGVLELSSSTYIILNAIGDSLFYFFPVFLGYTSAEKFGLNKFVGMAIGACLLHPNIAGLKATEPLYTLFAGTPLSSNVTATFMGLPIILMNYANSVLPVIFATFIGSKIEIVMKKITPTVIKMFFVPAITLVLTVILTLFIIGPVATWASLAVGQLIMSVRAFSPIVTGALVGGLWQVLVMFGIHQGLMPIMITNLMTNGFENVFCNMLAVPFTTFAVVLAVCLKTKDQKLKKVAMPAAISSFFGVSEPSIYGVTLPLKKPFIITLLSAAVGGAIMGFFNTSQYTQAGMGIFAIPGYINPQTGFDMGFYGTLIGVGVAMVLGFVLTWLFGYKNVETITETKEECEDELIKQEVFLSPVEGTIVPLQQVADEVFASGSLGKGIAIQPMNGNIYAPADGVVTTLFPTGHAIGLTTKSNAEILIHIGIDTVQMEGKGFTSHVKQGDTVKQGQLLVQFDSAMIQKAGYDDVVIVVITNTDKFLEVITSQDDTTNIHKELLAVAI